MLLCIKNYVIWYIYSDDSESSGGGGIFSGHKSGDMNVATSIDSSSRGGAGIMLVSSKPLQGT